MTSLPIGWFGVMPVLMPLMSWRDRHLMTI